MGGVVFSDYRVSPNFLLCWGWVVVEVEVGLGCDNILKNPKDRSTYLARYTGYTSFSSKR